MKLIVFIYNKWGIGLGRGDKVERAMRVGPRRAEKNAGWVVYLTVSFYTPTFFFLYPHKVVQRQNYPYINCIFFFVFRIMKSGKFSDSRFW